MINAFNTIITGLSVISHVILVLLLIYTILRLNKKFKQKTKNIEKKVTRNAIIIGFITSVIATLGSLFYSEIAGFVPCLLCWYQRIFMYVLPIIYLSALIYKDKNYKRYTIPISATGLLIAIYHILVQLTPRFSCVSDGVDCSIGYVLGFGYITIPIMSATAFLIVLITSIIQK